MTKNNLLDYWRMKNPTRKQFTWFKASNNGQYSRLDYWLISDINEVNNCEISALPLTDNCVISLSLSLGGNSVLDDTNFCNEV